MTEPSTRRGTVTTGRHPSAASAGRAIRRRARPWWRSAVIYQVYVRELRRRRTATARATSPASARGCRYLRDLGVDAIWFTPWYVSPLADGGYDVADYRAIDPRFGTLAEAEALIAEALALGIRTIVDVVPNHVSDQHPWFQAALAAGPGSPERERFWFRPGLGRRTATMPPTSWVSNFGGRDLDPDDRTPTARPGEWYLHLFTPEQPDLNWDHPDVRARARGRSCGSGSTAAWPASASTPRPCWSRTRRCPRCPTSPAPASTRTPTATSCTTIYRELAARSPTATPARGCSSARSGCPTSSASPRYLRPDELHTAFNFDFMAAPVGRGRACATRSTAPSRPTRRSARRRPGCCPTTTSRGRSPATAARTPPSPSRASGSARRPTSTSAAAGPAPPPCSPRRCPARSTSTRATSSASHEVEDLPLDRIQDPMHFRSGGIDPGRDGCRVPLPWSGDAPPFGFSPTVRRPSRGCPSPRTGPALTVERPGGRPRSMLALYRAALRLRRRTPELGDGPLDWLTSGAGRARVPRAAPASSASSTSRRPGAAAGPASAILLASADLSDGHLPPDATAWLRPDQPTPRAWLTAARIDDGTRHGSSRRHQRTHTMKE